MHILTVSPIPEEQDHMLHTFHCEKCGKDTGFKFEKSKWPAGLSTKENLSEEGLSFPKI